MPRLTQLQRKHNQERINRAAEIIQGYESKVTGEDAATCLRDVLARPDALRQSQEPQH